MDIDIFISILTLLIAIIVDWKEIKIRVFGSEVSPKAIQLIAIIVAIVTGFFVYPAFIDEYFTAVFFQNPGAARDIIMIIGTIPLTIGTLYAVRWLLEKIRL